MRRRSTRWGAVAGVLFSLVLASGGTAMAQAGDDGASSDGDATGTVAGEQTTTTPIKHFVTLMQADHTFDSYFGTYPGADGIPAGTCMPTARAGECIEPWSIQGSELEDLRDDTETFDRQYAGGRMDGFVTAFDDAPLANPALPMGHYDRDELPFYWNVADEFVLFDRNFTSAHGGSVANHMYWVTGTPGGEEETIPDEGFTAPTIFDRLEESGISWKFYVENYDPTITFRSRGVGDRASQVIRCPLLAYARFVDDPDLKAHIVPIDQYYQDLDDGTLPAVSYVVPSGSSEHPPGSVAAGQAFVSNLIGGLMRSSAWSTSAFMWSYDDWGGFYDHVRPPQVDERGYGFRSPALLVSPYARRGVVDHTQIDFTSQLKFIEQNWGLEPLASRDQAAIGLSSAFDFDAPPREPAFVSPDVVTDQVRVKGQGVVYASYGVGILIGGGIGLGAVVHARRRQGARGEAGAT